MARNLIDKAFTRNVFFSYGAQALKIGLGFAWMTVLTKSAGIGLYGMVALLTSLSGLLTNFLSFRTNEAVVKFYKRGEHEHAPGLCRLALVAGLSLDLAVALLIFGLVRLLADPVADALLKDPRAAAAVGAYAWVVSITFIRGTGVGLLTAQEKFKVVNVLSVVEQAIKLALLIVVIQLGIPLSLETVIWIIVASAAVVTALIAARPFVELLGRLRHVSVPGGEFPQYARFSLSTFVSSTLKVGNQNVDTMILGFLTDPTKVGIYSLFRQFLNPLTIAVGPFYEQIYPRFVKAVASDETAAVRHTIHQTNKLLSKWSALLLAGIVPITIAYAWYIHLRPSANYVAAFLFMAGSAWLVQRLW
ncbi:MAG: oligosaccharide flippase family protein, partial [Fimbriimonadaceae bacterium]|nr:oligosaccharide flippase family protein [Fimbriimonadaceae bacterium]